MGILLTVSRKVTKNQSPAGSQKHCFYYVLRWRTEEWGWKFFKLVFRGHLCPLGCICSTPQEQGASSQAPCWPEWRMTKAESETLVLLKPVGVSSPTQQAQDFFLQNNYRNTKILDTAICWGHTLISKRKYVVEITGMSSSSFKYNHLTPWGQKWWFYLALHKESGLLIFSSLFQWTLVGKTPHQPSGPRMSLHQRLHGFCSLLLGSVDYHQLFSGPLLGKEQEGRQANWTESIRNIGLKQNTWKV